MSESLSAEAIREIERLTKLSVQTTFVKRPGDPAHVVWEIGPDGNAEQQTVEPAPLAVHLETPDAFLEYVESAAKEVETGIEVYYSESSLVMLS